MAVLLGIASHLIWAQCGSGSETVYGSGSWIGYVYEGSNTFTTANFSGRIYESENFDSSFCGSADCDFATDACNVNANTFSVRYRMNQTYAAGVYGITIGGDDGVRLSLDGGSTYVISDYSNHSYRTTYDEIVLNGNYDLVLDYYEDGGDSRVSIDITFLGTHWGGRIGSDQMICAVAPFDPDAFTSQFPAQFSDGSTASYQWQSSSDNSTWSDISGATFATYDIPSGFAGTLTYYRRQATGGGNTVNTSSLSVYAQEQQGDETSYGSESWIGYVYAGGADNYTDYRGEVFESETFDEGFGGDNVISSTSGCDFQTENFTVRFKMQKNFDFGEYDFTVGGDDGYRLSIDGGATWIVDNYGYHGYATTTSAVQVLDGTYNLVLEYFEGGGQNRVTFDYNLIRPLPVSYLFFNAERVAAGVKLQWATVTEKNNDYFEVLKSTDGLKWKSLGQVDGNGTTNEKQDYQFVDYESSNAVYYQLNQVDYDGQSELSKFVFVGSNQQTGSLKVYPNPVIDHVDIEWSGRVVTEVLLMNLFGQEIYRGGVSGLDFSDLTRGVYMLKVSDLSGEERLSKLVKQ